MDAKKVRDELELIRSAAIKAQDEGVAAGDNNKVDWCLRYIERRIVTIREQLATMSGRDPHRSNPNADRIA